MIASMVMPKPCSRAKAKRSGTGMGRRMSMNMRTVVSESAPEQYCSRRRMRSCGQVLLPDAGVGGPAGVDGADARIGVGLEHRVGMRARAQVVRAVGDAGDAGVEQRQHRQEIADIEVVRAGTRPRSRRAASSRIRTRSASGMTRRNWFCQQWRWPSMMPGMTIMPPISMTIAPPSCRRGGEVGANRLDPAAADEHVALVEIPDLRVDGDDGRAFQEDPIARPGAIKTILDRRPFRRGLLVIGACPHGAPHRLDTGKR